MQIHPAIAWRFAPAPRAMLDAAARGDKGAREKLQQWLVGEDKLESCFVTGLRMLAHASAYCASTKWGRSSWTTFALYVSGTSCSANPLGKTAARNGLYKKIRPQLLAEMKRGT